MSPHKHFAVLPFLLAASAGALAQSPPEPPPAAPTAAEAAAATLRDDVTRVVDRVEAQRGGKAPSGFRALRSTREERDAVVDAAVAGRLSHARLAARGAAWADLGLGDRDAPARLLRRLETDLESAVLDGGGTQLLISDEVLTDRDFVDETGDQGGSAVLLATGIRPDEPLVAHMVVHALQRARARSASAEPPATTDGILARRAWEEGEANLIAIGLLFQGLRLADAVLQPEIDPAEILDGRLVAPGLEALPHPDSAFLYFVYEEGYAHAVRAYRGGGFRALEQAAAGRKTTRDLLHPDGPASPLQDPPPIRPLPGDGYAVTDEDSLGEHGIFALVSGRTGKDDLALAAGDGWRFDRLVRWEAKPPGAAGGVTTWETQWASDDEAAEFVYSIGRVIEDGFGGTAAPEETSGRRSWTTAERVFRVERLGRAVHVRVAGSSEDASLESAATKAQIIKH